MGLDGDWARFGKLVAARRDELDLTQREAADRADVSEQLWRAVETAYRPPFRRSGLAAIFRTLGWSPRCIEPVLAGGDPVLEAEDEPFDVQAKLARIQALVDEIRAHYRTPR